LRIAAGAFSQGQIPEPLGWARVEGLSPRQGLFIAQVVGDSMNEIASHGAWCVWEHLRAAGVAPPAPGQNLVVRRADANDPELGEYTFKQLVEGPDGRYLVPRSTNPMHRRMALVGDAGVEAIARWVAVLETGDDGRATR
jgi:phage repressor protein C with HTH and peptisase S24 domain